MERYIFLVDMNCFFISCETVRRPELAGKPAAVAGDPQKRAGIILTANYEARAFGVKTAMTIYEAQKFCPSIQLVPPDHTYYSACSRQVMDVLHHYTPIVEQNSVDEAWLDMTGCLRAGQMPEAAARSIMQAVKQECGLDCSIGISSNKFLAKMAADMKKPRGITTLWPADVRQRLWPLPVGEIYGVGKKMREKLAGIGIMTIGDLVQFGQESMRARFGKYGVEIYRHVCGIDHDPVTPHMTDEMKSIGRSTTLPQDITELAQAQQAVLPLCDDLAARARRHHKRGTTVQIQLKYADFTGITRQKPVSSTDTAKVIYDTACALLKEHWNGRPVRLVGVALSGFEKGENRQISFTDLLGVPETPKRKDTKLEEAVDRIRGKYGWQVIQRASLLEKKQKEKQSPF